jgi:hypothetical protein
MSTVSLATIFENNKERMTIKTMSMSETDPLEDNIVDVYIDHILDAAYFVTFTEEEKAMYNKDPKRLAHVVLGSTDYFFIIMILNEFDKPADMDLYKLKGIYIPQEHKIRFLKDLLARKLNGNLKSTDI